MHDARKRLRDGSLAGAELVAALDHVRDCPECANPALGERDADALRDMIAGATHGPHLDFMTQLVPFVEGTLDDATAEIAETHLESCASCSAEVEDLRELRRVFRRKPRAARFFIPAMAAGLAAVIATTYVLTRQPETPPAVPRVRVTSAPAPAVRYANSEWKVLVDRAVAARTLPFPKKLARLRQRPDVLRNGPAAAAGEFSPVGVIVRDTRPSFLWPASDGASYVVAVFAGDAEVARSGRLTTSSWVADRDLARGGSYVWQVEVHQGDEVTIIPAPPAPQAEFGIAAENDLREIEQARVSHPHDALLHAVLYARAGLKREAEEALRRAGGFH